MEPADPAVTPATSTAFTLSVRRECVKLLRACAAAIKQQQWLRLRFMLLLLLQLRLRLRLRPAPAPALAPAPAKAAALRSGLGAVGRTGV